MATTKFSLYRLFDRLQVMTSNERLMANRFAGGVAMIDKSRIPDIDILRVRGIGVTVARGRVRWRESV